MGTSQRVSRGFHRLGLVLAAVPLLAAILFMAYFFDLGWVANKANGVSFHDYLILFIPTWELVRKLAGLCRNSPTRLARRLWRGPRDRMGHRRVCSFVGSDNETLSGTVDR
jgi:hypothetical protein